eukprot:SAG31_NODE_7594_length_1645_cov_1.831177_1_plen_102_part_00
MQELPDFLCELYRKVHPKNEPTLDHWTEPTDQVRWLASNDGGIVLIDRGTLQRRHQNLHRVVQYQHPEDANNTIAIFDLLKAMESEATESDGTVANRRQRT